MSGFDAAWLNLREPADHAAIDTSLRQRLIQHFGQRQTLRIVDLGCGTGSNLRALAPHLPASQTWLLVDHDANLLATATDMRLTNAQITCRQFDFSDGAIAELIDGADLVTAAALFDLISPAIIARITDQVAAVGSAFYTTLIYDGDVTWQPEQTLDASMRIAFNRHQQSDKGFGPAAGAKAAPVLAAAFERHGYAVVTAPSPWHLDVSRAELRRATDQGWADAARETGLIAGPDIDTWLEARLADPRAVTNVGHIDVLALPRTLR